MKASNLSKLLSLALAGSLFFSQAKSQQKQEDKINAATQVLKDFGKMKESIPSQMLKVTEGIIIVPRLLNAGLGVGAKRGKGIAMAKLENGTWSDPVFITITGGSVGFQAGIQSVDLVLIFKNSSTLQKIGGGSFTLGGDISATAGPVGRNSSASTDYKMEAEVYSYSRSKGLFAGISLQGAAIDIDDSGDKDFYGKDVDSKTLFTGSGESNMASVKALKEELESLYK
ncbi:MAG TPA: lipid-binding SYLF domain-containing protein [Parafilimonas sp.]|jgi:lipid-binding SYLF domain-containing protein